MSYKSTIASLLLTLKFLVTSLENDPEDSIVTVVPPTDEPSEEEVEAMEGESATEEPEVVGEDKESEEDNKEE